MDAWCKANRRKQHRCVYGNACVLAALRNVVNIAVRVFSTAGRCVHIRWRDGVAVRTGVSVAAVASE